MGKEEREAGWKNKYKGCYLESLGKGDKGSRFLLPFILNVKTRIREAVL
jgi:hypothetical protein